MGGVYWYAVNTKAHHEDLTERSLQRLGLETFYPKIQQSKLVRCKQIIQVKPLFLGYLFARFNLDTHYRAVNYAQGVKKVISFGPVPTRVSEEIIEAIRSRVREGYVYIPSPMFKRGQTVMIQKGPFQGLEAIFEQDLGDDQRVVLLLRTLSYQARVVVDLEQVVNL
jgi:transcriptional antiterminator RfaH